MSHLIAFMIVADTEVHTIKVVDASAERKDATTLLGHVKDVLQLLAMPEWNVDVVAFTSDASGESRKARLMLRQELPHLVVPDCYAHQINLIVGDYFKVANSMLFAFTTKANDLISWLRSRPQIIGTLHSIQQRANLRALTIIRPVSTRWGSHYLAYRRLLQIKTALTLLVESDSSKPPPHQLLIKGDARAKAKAREMISIIQDSDNSFWNAILMVVQHLEPLAVAINITQASHCRLDEVLTTFGMLYKQFFTIYQSQPSSTLAANAVLASLARRWEKSDQDIFIVAVFLNPNLQCRLFHSQSGITIGHIYSLMRNLWERFYRTPVPFSLFSSIQDYLGFTGHFKDFKMWVDGETQDARTKVCIITIIILS